jgi:RNA polymerase sigma-70 factor (ECF subfamily)
MAFQSFDQAYLDSLVAGKPEVEQHFSEYFGELLAIKLRGKVRSPQLREDILQETLLRVLTYLRKHRRLDHPERLGAFVHTVCNNVLLEHFRAEGRTTEMPEHMSDPADPAGSQESSLVNEERKVEVRRVLETLPQKDRTLLKKIFFEEKDKDEVCQEMKVDRDYLRVLLHRAKARFREGLQRTGTAAAAAR